MSCPYIVTPFVQPRPAPAHFRFRRGPGATSDYVLYSLRAIIRVNSQELGPLPTLNWGNCAGGVQHKRRLRCSGRQGINSPRSVVGYFEFQFPFSSRHGRLGA